MMKDLFCKWLSIERYVMKLRFLKGLVASNHSKIASFLEIFVNVLALQKVANFIVARVRSKFTFSVSIDEDDVIFNDLLHFCAEQYNKSHKNIHSLFFATRRMPNNYYHKQDKYSLMRMLSPDRVVTFHYEGYRFQVLIERPTATAAGSLVDFKFIKSPNKLVIFAFTNKGLQKIENVIKKFVDDLNTFANSSDVYVRRWNDWQALNTPRLRNLNSVILPDGQKERILQDFKDFLSLEEFYIEKSIPYHRGYIFHGVPGSGKSSLISALASTLGLDLYIVNSSDLKKDENVLKLVSEIPPKSILVIEDIDTYRTAKTRDDDSVEEAANLSTLLNALDGIMTPHGLITVMTTNDKEALDYALTRKGRCDVVEFFGYLTKEQLQAMISFYFPEQKSFILPNIENVKLVPADISELFKQNFDNFSEFIQKVNDITITETAGSN